MLRLGPEELLLLVTFGGALLAAAVLVFVTERKRKRAAAMEAAFWEPDPAGPVPPRAAERGTAASQSRPPVDFAAARRRARVPALALQLVGFINAALGLLVVLCAFSGIGFSLGVEEGFIGVVNFLAALFIITGGQNLMRLDSHGLVLTGSIMAMVPCLSLCLLIGLPVGVWALVTASGPDVRPAFRK